jgi:hypothetical protein
VSTRADIDKLQKQGYGTPYIAVRTALQPARYIGNSIFSADSHIRDKSWINLHNMAASFGRAGWELGSLSLSFPSQNHLVNVLAGVSTAACAVACAGVGAGLFILGNSGDLLSRVVAAALGVQYYSPRPTAA